MRPELVEVGAQDLPAVLAAAGAWHARTPAPLRATPTGGQGHPAAAGTLSGPILDRSVVLALRSGVTPVALAVATEVPNPFGLGVEGVLQLFESPGVEPPAGARLLQAVEAEGRRRGWSYLRALRPGARAIEPPFVDGWELSSVTVSRVLDRPQPWRGRPPATLRTARPDDLPFVMELTCDALRRGLCPCERARVGEPAVRAAASRFLGELTGEDMAVLVAEVGGTRVGHALGRLAVRDEATGAVEAELYDAYVLDSHQGRGIARLLTAGVAYLAFERGRRRLRGMVGGHAPASVDRILQRLGRAGWRPELTTLVRPLAP